MKTKVLDSTMSVRGQSFDGSRIAQRGGQRFRAVIHHDSSYSFQGYARVDMWINEAGWKTIQAKAVASLPIGRHSAYAPHVEDEGHAWRQAMVASLDAMIDLGLSIIPAEPTDAPATDAPAKKRGRPTKGARPS
jgi:hypothetical protein